MDHRALKDGSGTLHIVYKLGGAPQCDPLPFKAIKLEVARPENQIACRAYISTKLHTQLYRLMISLFPKLELMDTEIQKYIAKGALSFACINSLVQKTEFVATPVPKGLIVEWRGDNCDASLKTLLLAINLSHACLELRDPSNSSSVGCLRSVNSIAEALFALKGQAGQLAPSPAVSPTKSAQMHFQSPAKAPLYSMKGVSAVREGIALVKACSSTQMREGAALLQAAAGDATTALKAVELGAMEALVAATATLLPGTAMGMTELLTLNTLTLTNLLDAVQPHSAGASRVVSALGKTLSKSCANPLLLCKVLVALLQRVDIRSEAMRQGLSSAICDVYLRKSPLVEATARALLISSPNGFSPDRISSRGSSVTSKSRRVTGEGFGSPLSASFSTATAAALDHQDASTTPLSVSGALPSFSPLQQNSTNSMQNPDVFVSIPSPMMMPDGPPKFHVPRLSLPGGDAESPTAVTPTIGGLTRSTRRAMAGTPWGRKNSSPAPWGSPTKRSASEGLEQSASVELNSLAAALGESLMAADLSAIVAHRRKSQITSGGTSPTTYPGISGSQDFNNILYDTMEPQPVSSRRPTVEAHKIFTTVKSMVSMDEESTSQGKTHASSLEIVGQNSACMMQLADVAQIKVLLLTALCSALPVLHAGPWPERDISSVLAAELLTPVGQSSTQGPFQQQLRRLAMDCLVKLSALTSKEALMNAKENTWSSPSSPNSATDTSNVFIVLAGCRLKQLLSTNKSMSSTTITEAVEVMQILAEYIQMMNRSHQVAVSVVYHVLASLQAALGVLQGAGVDPLEWQLQYWQLFHALVLVLAPLCASSADGATGRALLHLLLGDHSGAATILAAAELTLLQAPALQSGNKYLEFVYSHQLPVLQRAILAFFVSLAGLMGRQEAVAANVSAQPSSSYEALSRFGSMHLTPNTLPSLSSLPSFGLEERAALLDEHPGYDVLLPMTGTGRKPLNRRHALHFFSFLVSPASGFTARVLEMEGGGHAGDSSPVPHHRPSVSGAVRLRGSVLELLKETLGAPGSPFAEEKATSDYYIRMHFVQFLKLYHNPTRDHQALFLCRKHMEVLLALSTTHGSLPHIRHRFLQLSVVDFFVRELSLEFESTQQRPRTLAAAGRLGSLPSGLGLGSSSRRHIRRLSSSSLNDSEKALVTDRSGGNASTASALSLNNPPVARTVSVPSLKLTAPKIDAATLSSPALTVPRLNLLSKEDRRGSSPMDAYSIGPISSHDNSPSSTSENPRKPPLAPPSARTTPRMPHTSRLGNPSMQGSGFVGNNGAPTSHCGDDISLIPKRIKTATTKIHVIAGAVSGDGDGDRDGGTSTRAWEGVSDVSVEQANNKQHTETGLPPGIVLSGDVDEDVKMLLALEGDDVSTDESSDEDEDDDDSASPTILALRRTPFLQPAVPFLDLQGNGDRLPMPMPKPQLLPSVSAQDLELAAADGGSDSENESVIGVGFRGAVAIGQCVVPRLTITPSLGRSTLELRCASAELAVAQEEESARAQAGRSFLGDLERSALGKGKMQAVAAVNRASGGIAIDVQGANFIAELSYADERRRRLVYKDPKLHLHVLHIIFSLVVDPDGQLDRAYCDQYPWDKKMANIPFLLTHHLNHPANATLLPKLLPRLEELGQGPPQFLRSLCGSFFRPEWYRNRARISGAPGAYATVYRSILPDWLGGGSVVLKMMDAPRHIQDRCSQVDVYSEVAILNVLAPKPLACKMFDHGLDPGSESLCLVLKDYKCSLKQWRAAQPSHPKDQLALYLTIFREIVQAVLSLLELNVVHFDLKCDNVLLEPLAAELASNAGSTLNKPSHAPTASLAKAEAEFWSPPTFSPPFKSVLGDFGESKLFNDKPYDALTARARGTDAFKSPEMLLVGGGQTRDHKSYDRRRRQGADASSDVWSLGCLLFELVTGKLLFNDTDWLQLVARVTSSGMPLITDEKAAMVRDLPGIEGLLQFLLVRDPSLRPTLPDVLDRVTEVLSSSRIPPYKRPCPQVELVKESSQRLSRGAHSLPSPVERGSVSGPTLPLPLTEALPVTSELIVAPIEAITKCEVLRKYNPSRIILLLASSKDDASTQERSTSGVLSSIPNSPTKSTRAAAGTPRGWRHTGPPSPKPRSPKEHTGWASKLASTITHWTGKHSHCSKSECDSDYALDPLTAVLQDPDLTECAEMCVKTGIDCVPLIVSVNEGGSSVWLKEALPLMKLKPENQEGTCVAVVPTPGLEGHAAALAVAHLVKVKGLGLYSAMVQAARWGLDVQLAQEQVDALQNFASR